MTPNILTLNESAKYLRISRNTMLRLIDKGDVPFAKVGGNYRFHREDLDALLQTRRRGAA